MIPGQCSHDLHGVASRSDVVEAQLRTRLSKVGNPSCVQHLIVVKERERERGREEERKRRGGEKGERK